MRVELAVSAPAGVALGVAVEITRNKCGHPRVGSLVLADALGLKVI